MGSSLVQIYSPRRLPPCDPTFWHGIGSRICDEEGCRDENEEGRHEEDRHEEDRHEGQGDEEGYEEGYEEGGEEGDEEGYEEVGDCQGQDGEGDGAQGVES